LTFSAERRSFRLAAQILNPQPDNQQSGYWLKSICSHASKLLSACLRVYERDRIFHNQLDCPQSGGKVSTSSTSSGAWISCSKSSSPEGVLIATFATYIPILLCFYFRLFLSKFVETPDP
jgi:hypothetical protein